MLCIVIIHIQYACPYFAIEFLVQSKIIIDAKLLFCCSHSGLLFNHEFLCFNKAGVYYRVKTQNKTGEQNLSIIFAYGDFVYSC